MFLTDGPSDHRPFDRRLVSLSIGLLAVAGLLAGGVGYFFWLRYAPERRVMELVRVSVVMAGQPGRPLTDVEFEEALALGTGGRYPCRWGALTAAAVRTQDREDRRARIEPIAAAMLDHPDEREQALGMCLLRVMERTAYLPQARRLMTVAADARLRVEATHAVAEFQALATEAADAR